MKIVYIRFGNMDHVFKCADYKLDNGAFTMTEVTDTAGMQFKWVGIPLHKIDNITVPINQEWFGS